MVVQDKSAGALVINNKNQFLLLRKRGGKQFSDYWGFPKGHPEKGETEKQAMKRELEEETGIKDFELVDDIRLKHHYFFKKGKSLVSKEVVFFVIKVGAPRIRLSKEHRDYAWLEYEKAVKKLSYDNQKKLLTRARNWLEKEI